MIGDFRTFASYSPRVRAAQHEQYLEGKQRDLQPSRPLGNGWWMLNAEDRAKRHDRIIAECDAHRAKTLASL